MTSGWRLELGAAIREARRSAGLAQADLADALGVRQSSVSQWERGTTSPTTRHLLALLGLLGAVLVRLLVGEDGSSKEAHASSGAT
jgi:transcriptional regulator with XRE-family HTH domain